MIKCTFFIGYREVLVQDCMKGGECLRGLEWELLNSVTIRLLIVFILIFSRYQRRVTPATYDLIKLDKKFVECVINFQKDIKIDTKLTKLDAFYTVDII